MKQLVAALVFISLQISTVISPTEFYPKEVNLFRLVYPKHAENWFFHTNLPKEPLVGQSINGKSWCPKFSSLFILSPEFVLRSLIYSSPDASAPHLHRDDNHEGHRYLSPLALVRASSSDRCIRSWGRCWWGPGSDGGGRVGARRRGWARWRWLCRWRRSRRRPRSCGRWPAAGARPGRCACRSTAVGTIPIYSASRPHSLRSRVGSCLHLLQPPRPQVISEDLPTIISDVSFPKSMMPGTLNVLFSHTVDHGTSWRSSCVIFFCWHLKVETTESYLLTLGES